MKRVLLGAAFFLLLVAPAFSGEVFNLTHETKHLTESGYQTDFYLTTPSGNWTVKLQRTLLDTVEVIHTDLDMDLSQENPCCSLFSSNFFPGEKVVVIAESKDQQRSCEKTCIPNPLSKASKKDAATVSAELQCVQGGTAYTLRFSQFRKGERCLFRSLSCGEQLAQELIIPDASFEMGYAPEVVGMLRGYACVEVTRENGEKMSLMLPWGSSFIS